MNYRVVFDEEALRAILAVRGNKRREQLFEIAAKLAGNPFREGDFTAFDTSGREFHFMVIGRYILSYRPDHAVKELRILDLQRAE